MIRLKAIAIALCTLLLFTAVVAEEGTGTDDNSSVSIAVNETGMNASHPVLDRARELRESAKELREKAKEHRQNILEQAKERRDNIREAWKDGKEQAKIVAYDFAIEQADVEMNATIAWFAANGINASALEQKRDEFLALTIELQNATNGGVNDVAEQLREKLKDFRGEAHDLAGNRSDELKLNISDSIVTGKKVLDEVKNRTCQHLENVSLKVFDKQVADAGHVLDVMENNTKLNVTALRTKLDEIKAMRPTLEAAYASCNRTAIEDAAKGIKDAWQELRRLHAQLVRDQAHAKIIEKLDDLIGKVDKVLARANATGADTSLLDADLAELNATVDKARADNAAGNYDAVKQDIEDAKRAFAKLRDGLKELLRSVEE